MANILITKNCNSACPYCFARDYMKQTAAKRPFITIEEFQECLNFLDRSKISAARLIGGEPSLHPQFPHLVRLALDRGKSIMVFSNGWMAEPALACLEEVAEDRCSVLLNTSASIWHHNHLGQELPDPLKRTLSRLGPRVILGFTIDSPSFDADFLLPLIEQYGCQHIIRLGLAQPALNGSSQYLHPKQYQPVAKQIARLAQQAIGRNIKIHFDCGFVRCMFSNEQMETLRHSHAEMNWNCSPILDLDFNNRVLCCFPLGDQFYRYFQAGEEASAFREAFQKQMEPYRTAGIYKECSSCSVKAYGHCTGGCLSAALTRFTHQDFKIQIPDKN